MVERTVLVVDDEASIRRFLSQLLERDPPPEIREEVFFGEVPLIRVKTAKDGHEALRVIVEEDPPPDVVVLDLKMPGLDGLEVLRRMRSYPKTKHTPVIVLTAYADQEVPALEAGATDFISKPVKVRVFWARLKNQLARVEQMEQREDLEQTLKFLVDLAETRNALTYQHITNVTRLSLKIGRMLRLPREEMEALRLGAMLHDIGNIAIPEELLQKEGRLTEMEFEQVKTHTTVGYELARKLQSLPEAARRVILYHHERWDGTGYPEGLKGEEIPLLARIVALADTYDVMRSVRPYRKEPMSHEEALFQIAQLAGKAFDPRLTEVFVGVLQEEGEAVV